MIELQGISVEYPQSQPLAAITHKFDTGTTAVMGPSGSGKSTLLRVISGSQFPTSGHVRIDGTAVDYASWRSPSDRRVSLIHQDFRLVPFLSVEHNLLLAAELRGVGRSADDVAAQLERVALPVTYKSRLPGTLSGGEQQRVAIARAMIAGSSVILADEPTGALDAENSARVTDLLVQLGEQAGLTVLVATHDPAVANRMDTILRLSEGALVKG